MSDMLESSWPDALADEAFVLMSPRRSSEDDLDSDEEGFGDELGESPDDEFDDPEDLEDEDEDDEEAPDTDDRAEATTKVLPKQPDEFVCQSCFLVKHPSQLSDAKRQLCRDCV